MSEPDVLKKAGQLFTLRFRGFHLLLYCQLLCNCCLEKTTFFN